MARTWALRLREMRLYLLSHGGLVKNREGYCHTICMFLEEDIFYCMGRLVMGCLVMGCLVIGMFSDGMFSDWDI